MDENKLEEEMKKIDEHVPEKVELNSETTILLKELSDTRAYLDIVLRDLEEIKQSKMMPVKVTKKKNIWKWVTLIETILILSGGIIFGIYTMNQESLPTMLAKETENVSDEMLDTTKVESIFLNDNLDQFVKDYIKPSNSKFEPSVVTLFGYEYLMLSNGDVDIYYRNEFPKEEVSYRQRIMIDNGSKITEFDWNYDFNKGIAGLVPYYGEYFSTNQTYLVFPLYEESNSSTIPKQIRSVLVDNLLEQEPMDVQKQLEEIFSVRYEEVGNNINDPDMRLHLKFGAATYTYAIGTQDYMTAVYDGENIISHDRYFSLSFEEDKIKVVSILHLTGEEYLGELSGRISVDNNRLHLSNVAYATYCLANQEDAENGGLIIPRTSILGENRISMWGFQNETYLLELSQVLERNVIKQEDLIKEKTGLSYYVNGEKKSIPGIDVSKYQGDIDWKKVKAAGYEFAILRVGFRGYNEGTLELDPYFEKNIKGANEAGIHVGVYFFSQAVNDEEALQEAQFVLEHIKGYKITYPVIIDTEHVANYNARANGLSRQVRTNVVKTFCEAVEKQGYRSMIYANTKWMIMGIDLEQLVDYDLWFAYYGNNLSFPYQFEIFQYTSEGTVPGIKGNVDLNISFKDYSIKN